MSFVDAAGPTIGSPRSKWHRLRVSVCDISITSSALSLDLLLLRCLLVRGSAMLGMGDCTGMGSTATSIVGPVWSFVLFDRVLIVKIVNII